MTLNNYLILILPVIAILLGVYLRIRQREKSRDKKSDDRGILEVQLSRNEDQKRDIQASSLSAENMFSALHGLLKSDPDLQEHISFEMVASGERGIRFYVTTPLSVLEFVESQIYAQYPTAIVNVVSDYTPAINPSHINYKVSSLVFSKPDYYPIRSFRDFETDPMSSLSSSVSTLSKSEEVWLQILTRPIADKWQQEGFDYVNKVREGQDPGKVKSTFNIFFDTVKKEISEIFTGVIVGLFTRPAEGVEVKGKYTTTPKISAAKETELKSIENKLSRMGFEAVIRVVSAAPEESRVDANLRGIIASFEQFSGTSINSLISKNEDNKELALNAYKKREFDPNRAIILNTEELATIYHFPLSHIDTPNISWVYSRKSEPPANLPTENCTYLGETVYRNQSVKFGIRNDNDDRLRHVYVIGKSGTGKSSLFVTMMAQDIANGEGAAILDPHGETIENVLDRIPDNRIEDVIYLDPSDTEYPVGLNLLEIDDPSQKNLMASGLVSAIKQHFDFSWGPRLEYLLNYCVLTLLEVPGTTMLGITRLLEDQNYLNYILHFVKDPVVQKFWSEEFKQMKGNQKLVTEAISPIQNKVNRFLASTTIRNILGQRKSTIDIWDAMNSGKILLMNLSKGKIGQDNANLLGALLVSRIQFYALQRAKIPNEKRRPFYLYVDEFQNFATGSFEEILSESRKYKLGLNLTHQFTGQLPEDLLKAVYGNVGTIITFALGAPDAKELAKEFAPYFSEEDIISLERFQVYMKLMVDGMTSHPFSAKILVPWDDEFLIKKTGNKEKVLQRSREKYGVPREKVESKVNKWLSTRFDKGMAIAQEYSGKNINGSIGNNFESTEEK
ncbi:MAG TPA: type IV secretion system DNA-binding domain-containing protein [bacterium]|jgi:DNA helicase HerA-like ATPase|nr:type IV secretion system DNA-binding domain-containing protein [bacterium]